MRRVLFVLVVSAILLLVLAVPALAKQNCSTDESTGITTCIGGAGSGETFNDDPDAPDAVGGGGLGFGGIRVESAEGDPLEFIGGRGNGGGNATLESPGFGGGSGSGPGEVGGSGGTFE